MTRAAGRLIFIHGASSSGKSTLTAALRPKLPTPFWHMSIDKFRDSGAWDMDAFGPDGHDWQAYRTSYFDGFHAAVAAVMSSGNDVILEHILDTAGWQADLQARMAGADVFFVGLMTNPDTLTEREEARGDRAIGSALRDSETIHNGRSYDLTLDGATDPDTNAQALLSAWEKRTGASSFFKTGDT